MLDDLAGAAAGVLVSSMGSDHWEERVRPTFVHIYGMAMKEDVGPTLDSFRRDVRSGTISARDAALIWKSKIRLAFRRGVIANEVHQFIEDFRPDLDLGTCPSCAARVEAGDIYCAECGEVLGGPVPVPTPGPSTEAHGAVDQAVDSILRQPPTPTSQDHVDFRRANFHAPVIGVQNNYGTAAPAATADSWPLFFDFRRKTLGVRPVSAFGDEATLPPYIPRDGDDELDMLVTEGLREGGLVIVTGESLSGKTMTAWAALNRNAEDGTRLFNAHPGTDLRELPAALRGRDRATGYVVWLDDLESHLDERGLVAGPLAQLVHEGALVLATMRDTAYETHRFGDHPTARALRGARTVDVTREWSEAELARLARADDRRLTDLPRWRGGLGVTEFLAVGPELWEEWRRAGRPGGRANGHLLVRAAVDAARCGLTSGLPLETWEHLINTRAIYGPLVLDGPPSQDDLDWATRPRLGVCGLLVPGEEAGTWRASGTLVADANRCPDLSALTPHIWGSVTRVAAEREVPERHEVSRLARAAVRVSAEAGDEQAALILAVLSTWAEDDRETRRWWGKVAEDDPSMAYMLGRYLLLEQRDPEGAVPHLRTAVEAGTAEPVEELGFLFLERALHWLGSAAQNGGAAAAEVVPALRAALRDKGFEAVMTQRYTRDPEQPPHPGPELSAQRAVSTAVALGLRHSEAALEASSAPAPDTVKE
ncbi:hypothetical protein [Streptomyces sp. NPDC003635]